MPSLSEETKGRIDHLEPGSVIGIVGGGQLGRMMALSARYHGFRIGVLDPTPDAPAAQVADFQETADYGDLEALKRLAERSDVLTYEFENVDADAMASIQLPGGRLTVLTSWIQPWRSWECPLCSRREPVAMTATARRSCAPRRIFRPCRRG